MDRLYLDPAVQELLVDLAWHGEPYIVGGYVRDLLLGRSSKDIDIEWFAVYPEQVEPKLKALGYPFERRSEVFPVWVIKHPTLGDVEIALPRTERKVGKGYNGFEATVDPYMSLYDAAMRRDFTINAIYCDKDGELHDPLNGAYDLRVKIIRPCSTETFFDDPTRLLRVGYFVNKLGFGASRTLFDLITDQVIDELGNTDPNALKQFWDKFFANTSNTLDLEIAFYFFEEIGITQRYFPSLLQLDRVKQNKQHHPEGDVWAHTLNCVTMAAKKGGLWPYIALFHDVGKATTTDKELRSPGHEAESVRMAVEDLPFFGFSSYSNKKEYSKILEIIKYHMIFMDNSPKRLLMIADGLRHTTMNELVEWLEIDMLGRLASASDIWFKISSYQNQLEQLGILNGPMPRIITGNDIKSIFNLKPAKGSNLIGVLLGKVRKQQYENPGMAYVDAIAYLKTCHEVRKLNGSDIIEHFDVEGEAVGRLVNLALEYQIRGFTERQTLQQLQWDLGSDYV